MPVATFPITWARTQNIMSQLGYDLASSSADGKAKIFVLRQGVPTEELRNPVSILLPDYTNAKGEPAYEKDYLVDLILMATKGIELGKVQAAIQASRHFDT